MKEYFDRIAPSWITRVGLVAMTIGAAIALLYHGVILAILPLPDGMEEVIAYAGHVMSFIGMIVTLAGVLIQGHRLSARNDTSAQNDLPERVPYPLSDHRK